MPTRKKVPASTAASKKPVKTKVVKKQTAKAAGAKKANVAANGATQTDPVVEAYLRALEHPMKAEIQLVRSIILGAGRITEGIKWNSPSFRAPGGEFFATLDNRRTRDTVRLLLHSGAKPRADAVGSTDIHDPAGMLEWLAPDRAMINFTSRKDILARRSALEAIIAQWTAAL